MLLMINTPQHLIPTEPLSGRINETILAHLNLRNATVKIVPGFLGANSAQGFEVGSMGLQHVIGLVLAALFAAAIIAGLLIISRLASPAAGIAIASKPPRHQPSSSPLGYVYEGLKAELRRAYVRVISKLQELGIHLPPGAAPLEVAKEAEGRGYSWASRVARIYRDHIYAPREPPRGVVDEASRLAGEV
jgi:hypothetical protein